MNKNLIREITKKHLNKLYLIKEDDNFLGKLAGKIISKKNSIFDKEFSEKINKSFSDYLEKGNKSYDDVDFTDLNIVGDIDFSKGNFDSDQKKVIKLLIDHMNDIGITNPYTQIGILSVIDKESGCKVFKEIGYSNTSNSRIRDVFGSRASKYSDEELTDLKQNDEDFFEAMYGKDSGIKLGNTEVGDGWKYVGRGLNGLTGKSNYRKYGQMIGEPLESNPELVEDPEIAAKIAAAFFTKGNPNSIPEFTDKEEAAIHFSDINAGDRSADFHQIPAKESSKKFDVNFSIS
jgi:predicted chitinase